MASEDGSDNAENLERIALSLGELVLVAKRIAYAIEELTIRSPTDLRAEPCADCGSQLLPDGQRSDDEEPTPVECPACGETS